MTLCDRFVLGLGCIVVVACAAADPAEDEQGLAPGPGMADSEFTDAAEADGSETPEALAPMAAALADCEAPDGVDNAPQTVEEALTLMNSLPKPLSVECFVHSLARPLEVYLTSSPFSAQPADGEANPRVFLFLGDALILSVVPAGVGRDLLELSFLTSPTRSIKAEIPFPLTRDVTPEGMAEHIALSTGSICALCHQDEQPADSHFLGAFESGALRPMRNYDVTLESLAQERERCDQKSTPERCAMLSALFDPGEVRFRDFPEEMPTFL